MAGVLLRREPGAGDLWVRAQLAGGAEHTSVCRRLSAISGFYHYCAAHDLVAGVPRPPGWHGRRWIRATPATVGLDRDQARTVLAAADADPGPRRLRTAAIAMHA